MSFEEEAARLVDVVGAFKVDRMEERDHAVALVKRAAAHVQAVGIEQACRDFKDPNGGFMHGEFYVFANDVNGVQLCNPRSPPVRYPSTKRTRRARISCARISRWRRPRARAGTPITIPTPLPEKST